MSESPSASLVDRVRHLITETFEISEEDANAHAAGIVTLAEGWGSAQTATQLDWLYLIKKNLGKELIWRSAAERQKFESDQTQRYGAYEEYMRNQKQSSRSRPMR